MKYSSMRLNKLLLVKTVLVLSESLSLELVDTACTKNSVLLHVCACIQNERELFILIICVV